jgi:hypothetical protein
LPLLKKRAGLLNKWKTLKMYHIRRGGVLKTWHVIFLGTCIIVAAIIISIGLNGIDKSIDALFSAL